MMLRNPAVAGTFYYNDRGMLMEQVMECINPKAKKTAATGVIVPHAGFVYSGRVAGEVYSAIEMPDTFVILGPNHTGLGGDFSAMTSGVWKMPLGDVPVDSALAESILKRSKMLEIDDMAHRREHSIEVQLPFMQYFSDHIQIVPIAVKHYEPDDRFLSACTEVGRAIASAIRETKERVTLVASTDLSHYETQETAEKNDKKALDAIISLDEKKLFSEVSKNNITMCGYGPAAAVLAACRELGGRNARLVRYATSAEASGDYSQVVGYGGVIISP